MKKETSKKELIGKQEKKILAKIRSRLKNFVTPEPKNAIHSKKS